MRKPFKQLLVALLAVVMVLSVMACTPLGPETPETKITLSATTLTLEVGQDAELTATITPEDLEISWSSSDANVAKYEDGKVYALAEGTATITASNGEVSEACTVTVTAPVITDSIELSSSSMTLETGASKSLTATTVPEDMQLEWSSSDANVAKYEEGRVYGLSAGTATITATNGTLSATCVVTVNDLIEDGINKTLIAKTEVKEFATQEFAADAGLLTMGEGASYDANAQGIELLDQGYAFVKLQMPEMLPHYDYKGNESREGFEGNDSYFIRFKALGNGGGMEVLLVLENDMTSIMDPVMLNAEEGLYQVEIPTSLSQTVVSVVFKNPAPEEAGTTATLTYVDIVKELNPTLDRVAYYSDMLAWMPTLDKGFEPHTITAANGWSGWKGVSYGNISHNYIAYLDSFGAALEYADYGDANLTFDGVQFFAKVLIPEGTKKLTYWAGHVGNPSAYRIQIFDGEQFVNLTASSSKVNPNRVAANEGWLLTSQDYASSALAEVAIPAEYVGKTVIVSFAAKFNDGASFGMRFNNIRFSAEDVIVPPAYSDGVNINDIVALDAVSGAEHSFASGAAGFVAAWGAEYSNGAIQMSGTTVPEDASANAAVYAKLEVPASFNYLRFAYNLAAGATVQMRVRMIDFESQQSTDIVGWTTLNGKDADQVLQVQAFPTVFVGTVGLIIEAKYEDQATLNLKGLAFSSATRDEAGYDMDAIKYLTAQDMPENNTLTFISGELEKWAIFTSHDDINTKGMANSPWLQMQSTNVAGDYSVLAAYKTTLGQFISLTVKSGSIGDVTGTAMIRIRVLLADGTFVNLTKENVTDENGWFNGCGESIVNYGWGGITENVLDVDASLANQEVVLIIEYDKEISSNWNVLLESLTFA
ncbi:MAG: Ig domain-containing protein [Clostridia bacterium]|nr:Ig domain-containing protein [Clostridia bacterium]